MVPSPKCTWRTLVFRRYSSSSRTIKRVPADNRVFVSGRGVFTERYVNAINVKCLLFIFRRAPLILANRIEIAHPRKHTV